MKKYTFSTTGLRYDDKLCFRVDDGPHTMVLFPFDVQCNKIHIFLCLVLRVRRLHVNAPVQWPNIDIYANTHWMVQPYCDMKT